MIDPLKATKGRRMSERTHQTKHAKSGSATTVKSSKRAASEASHKAPSKRLRPSKSAGAAPSNVAAASPPAGKSSVLAAGAKAPAFRLPRDGGNTVSLADYAGTKLVLFFYPRADTPGCTKEAIDFSRLSSAFAENQTAVLGISADAPLAQEAFRDKHQLSTPLVSDEQHTTLEA